MGNDKWGTTSTSHSSTYGKPARTPIRQIWALNEAGHTSIEWFREFLVTLTLEQPLSRTLEQTDPELLREGSHVRYYL